MQGQALKSYFDSIPKAPLLALVAGKVSDGRIPRVRPKAGPRTSLALLETFLEQKVLDGAQEWTPEQGTPQSLPLRKQGVR